MENSVTSNDLWQNVFFVNPEQKSCITVGWMKMSIILSKCIQEIYVFSNCLLFADGISLPLGWPGNAQSS